MAKAFLIVGSTGAGKTTYAREICSRRQAQLFSIDEWMKSLFWMDAPAGGNPEWALERVRRCESQIWKTAERILAAGTPVVLDLGFSKRTQRDRWKALVEASGHEPQMHFLDIPVEVRKARVLERNKGLSPTFEFKVDEATFAWMESYFEAPSADELEGAVAQMESTVSFVRGS